MPEAQKQKPIVLSFKTWRKLKMECVEHGLTFDQLVDMLVQEHLAKKLEAITNEQ